MKRSELFDAKESSKKLNTLKEEIRMKTLLATTLTILILFVAVPFSHASYFVSRLTEDNYDDVKPQINNTGEVVYEKHLEGDIEIYGHNGYYGYSEYNISHLPNSFDYNPQINSDGDVLWESDRKLEHVIFLQPWDHPYLFALTSLNPNPNNPSQYLPMVYHGETNPQFNDNGQIVWRSLTYDPDQGSERDNIWLFTSGSPDSRIENLTKGVGASGTESTTDLSPKINQHPQINANGAVVWQRKVNYGFLTLQDEHYFDIFLYDGQESKNISGMNVDDTNPQINDYGTVVWEREGDIYRYSGGYTEIISDNSGYTNSAPQIINSCGVVVWQGCNNSDCEIFIYNGISAVNISNAPGYNDESPRINESGKVVWVRDYSDIEGYYSIDLYLKGQEVMLYDPYENTLANISNRNGDDVDPQINDKDEVVWSGYHEGNWEIFKATFAVLGVSSGYKPTVGPQVETDVGIIGKVEVGMGPQVNVVEAIALCPALEALSKTGENQMEVAPYEKEYTKSINAVPQIKWSRFQTN